MRGVYDTPGCQNIPHEEDFRPVARCIRNPGKRPFPVGYLWPVDTLAPGNSGEWHRLQLYHVHHNHEIKTRVKYSLPGTQNKGAADEDVRGERKSEHEKGDDPYPARRFLCKRLSNLRLTLNSYLAIDTPYPDR